MVSKTSAKAAAERYADEYVGTDANMINASILVRDDTFRSLAIAREQLGYVGGMLPGVYDVDRDVPVERYTAGQTDAARDAVERAMASRASEVFTDAYQRREDATDEPRVEQVTL
jgi:hypothetical protein